MGIVDFMTRFGSAALSAPWRAGMAGGRLLARRQKLAYVPYTRKQLERSFPAESLLNLQDCTSVPDFTTSCLDDAKVGWLAEQLHARSRARRNTVHYLNEPRGHAYLFESERHELSAAAAEALESAASTNLPLRALIAGFAGGGGELADRPASLWERFELGIDGNFWETPDLFAVDHLSAPTLTHQRILHDEPVRGPVRLGNAVVRFTGARRILAGPCTVFTGTAVTLVPHPLDGAAQWMLVWHPASRTTSFHVVGVGVNPLSILDGFNVPFAGSVFLTMYRSFLTVLPELTAFPLRYPDLSSTRAGLAALDRLVAAKDSGLSTDRTLIRIANSLTGVPASLREILGPQVVGTPVDIPPSTGTDGGPPAEGAPNPLIDSVDPEADRSVARIVDQLSSEQLLALPAFPDGESVGAAYKSDIEALIRQGSDRD